MKRVELDFYINLLDIKIAGLEGPSKLNTLNYDICIENLVKSGMMINEADFSEEGARVGMDLLFYNEAPYHVKKADYLLGYDDNNQGVMITTFPGDEYTVSKVWVNKDDFNN